MRLALFPALVIAAAIVFLLIVTSSADGSPRSVKAAICEVFGPRCAPALRVAHCESNLNPRAVGRAGERGIYQIHWVHWGWLDESRLFEPRYNARIAFRLSKGGTDWRPWTCAA